MLGIFEEIYPFRDKEMLYEMMNEIKKVNYDTLIATKYESRGIFVNNKEITNVDLDKIYAQQD